MATDILLLGGSSVSRIGGRGPSASSETSNEFKLTTQRFSPRTSGGDAEFRRLYVTITYTGQVRLTITPIVDGFEYAGAAKTVIGDRANGGKETFVVPISRTFSGRVGRFGIRGSALQIKIEGSFANQVETWHIDEINVMYKTGHRARNIAND